MNTILLLAYLRWHDGLIDKYDVLLKCFSLTYAAVLKISTCLSAFMKEIHLSFVSPPWRSCSHGNAGGGPVNQAAKTRLRTHIYIYTYISL